MNFIAFFRQIRKRTQSQSSRSHPNIQRADAISNLPLNANMGNVDFAIHIDPDLILKILWRNYLFDRSNNILITENKDMKVP